ncbi:MAG: PilW family protein [Magnetococcus sp. YQC-5]
MALIALHSVKQRGFSLIEVMASMTIGLVILMAVVSMLVTATRSQKDLGDSSQLIENGNYSINTLYDNLRLAGYYGHYFNSISPPATLPDPCLVTASDLQAAMALPVQGYEATSLTTRANVTATTCYTSNLLGNNNVKPGSDILVVRRAATNILTGTPINNQMYLQSNVVTAAIQVGSSSANVPTTTADNGTVTIQKRNGATVLPADTRAFHVTVYFVAPCSVAKASTGICSTGDDTIPTLKRLELSVNGGVTAMVITPLAEGVEYLKFLYGVDTTTTTDPSTGLVGDGLPDDYIPASSVTQWNTVMSVQIYLLVRSSMPTSGFTDDKTYTLGNTTIAPTDITTAELSYKRHAFSSEVRLINLAGPRSTL